MAYHCRESRYSIEVYGSLFKSKHLYLAEAKVEKKKYYCNYFLLSFGQLEEGVSLDGQKEKAGGAFVA